MNGASAEADIPVGVELTELDSGVRVVSEAVPSVRSVALGLWVRAGSRDETPNQAGVSHFLEHLLFKGTGRYSAVELAELFDGLGAATNAATGKETTHLHARFLDEHTERAFDVLAEMMLHPTYPEVDSEREVVLEEIAMYEDEPSDRVHDYLAHAVFGESHALGRRVLGAADVIAGIPVPDIAAYHDAHYVGPNLVVAAAGHVDHDEVVELSRRYFDAAEGARGEWPTRNGGPPAPTVEFHAKETEQFHITFGGPGIARADERRFALAVLDAVLGGATSSRLFREVREKRGLAYAVGSYSDQFIEQGLIGVYVGTRGENVAEACEVIGAEVAALRSEGISPDELARAKEHVKGRMVLALEATAARMSRVARSILLGVPLLALDEMLRRVDAVEIDEVADLAAQLYAPGALSAACIGADEQRFTEAAGAVCEAAA